MHCARSIAHVSSSMGKLNQSISLLLIIFTFFICIDICVNLHLYIYLLLRSITTTYTRQASKSTESRSLTFGISTYYKHRSWYVMTWIYGCKNLKPQNILLMQPPNRDICQVNPSDCIQEISPTFHGAKKTLSIKKRSMAT